MAMTTMAAWPSKQAAATARQQQQQQHVVALFRMHTVADAGKCPPLKIHLFPPQVWIDGGDDGGRRRDLLLRQRRWRD